MCGLIISVMALMQCERDVLLYYPYHTFEHVLNCCAASFDPSVISIKINIYRVAKDSRIIDR